MEPGVTDGETRRRVREPMHRGRCGVQLPLGVSPSTLPRPLRSPPG